MKTSTRVVLATILVAAGFAIQALFASAVAKEVASHRWPELTRTIDETLRRYHYDPAELDRSNYALAKDQVEQLGYTAETFEDFVSGFNAIWGKGPFSHVRLQIARASAEDTAAYLDRMHVGADGVKLEWREDTAVLTINTMMGVDTIERIKAAYNEITTRDTRALIIDLRNNQGGAFACVPLVGHTLVSSYDAGVFVSQAWTNKIRRAPIGKT